MTLITLSKKCLEEWGDLDPNLRQIFLNLWTHWPTAALRITSIHRSMEQDRKIKGQTKKEYRRGIHTVGPPYRALDVGARELGASMGTEMIRLANLINDQWEYDPARPAMVVCYVRPHGTGPHFHLQVHPNTRRRGCEERA